MEDPGLVARIIREAEAERIDEHNWGSCPRCGCPVIQGKRGYGCSAWKDGCKFVLWPTYKDYELKPAEIRELEAYGVERIYHPDDGMHMGLVEMIEDVVKRAAEHRVATAAPAWEAAMTSGNRRSTRSSVPWTASPRTRP